MIMFDKMFDAYHKKAPDNRQGPDFTFKTKRARRESNPRPLVPKTCVCSPQASLYVPFSTFVLKPHAPILKLISLYVATYPEQSISYLLANYLTHFNFE